MEDHARVEQVRCRAERSEVGHNMGLENEDCQDRTGKADILVGCLSADAAGVVADFGGQVWPNDLVDWTDVFWLEVRATGRPSLLGATWKQSWRSVRATSTPRMADLA